MKMYRGVLTAMFFLMLSSPVLAAEVVKLGFFDMQTIIERSEIGKDGADKFRLEKEKVRERLAEKLREIKELDDEFKKKENVWSEDVKKKKTQEIMAKKMEYERIAYQENLHLGKLERELLRPMQDKVFAIVIRIGKEEGYAMIWEMRRAGLAYAPPSLELTDRIIRELNEAEAKEERKPGSKKQ